MGVETRLVKSLIVPWENYLQTVFVGQFRKGGAPLGTEEPKHLSWCVGSNLICLLHVVTSGKGPTTIGLKITTQSPDEPESRGGEIRGGLKKLLNLCHTTFEKTAARRIPKLNAGVGQECQRWCARASLANRIARNQTQRIKSTYGRSDSGESHGCY